MTTKLAGRVALVTGAGGGIGRAIAVLFAAEGAAVACADIDGGTAAETARSIAAAGGRAEAIRCDVGRPDETRAAVNRARETFGALHVLVSNAAYFPPTQPLTHVADDVWLRAFAVNVHGAFYLCRAAIPHLARAGGGAVILTASQMGSVGHPGDVAYCASKGALLTMAKALALELAPSGIRVNTLSPGGVATETMIRNHGSRERAEAAWGRPMHPLGRLGTPEEMARAALFLASDDSSFMTGADLLVDGGYTAC